MAGAAGEGREGVGPAGGAGPGARAAHDCVVCANNLDTPETDVLTRNKLPQVSTDTIDRALL